MLNEHDRMLNRNVWTVSDKNQVTKTDKVLITTWAMKKKPNGNYRGRINAHGYEQIDGLHYNISNTAAPVTNDTTIWIIITLAIMAGWKGYLIDAKGEFLKGRFDIDSKRVRIIDFTH
jgi:Reverse transcriptase (RNA-dependent DNA polymerase)